MNNTEQKLFGTYINIGDHIQLRAVADVQAMTFYSFHELPICQEVVVDSNTGVKKSIFFFLDKHPKSLDHIDDMWLKQMFIKQVTAAIGEMMKNSCEISNVLWASDVLRKTMKVIEERNAQKPARAKVTFHARDESPVEGEHLLDLQIPANGHQITAMVYLGSSAHLPPNPLEDDLAKLAASLFGGKAKDGLERLKRQVHTQSFRYGDLELTARVIFPFEEAQDWYPADVLGDILKQYITDAGQRIYGMFGVMR